MQHSLGDAKRIREVQRSGVFGLEDLFWIAGALSCALRVSMAFDTHKKLADHLPAVARDGTYGSGTVCAHLYFSFADSVEPGNRSFGHFDLLVRSEGTAGLAKWFADQVAWTGEKFAFHVYIEYIAFIYIHTLLLDIELE